MEILKILGWIVGGYICIAMLFCLFGISPQFIIGFIAKVLGAVLNFTRKYWMSYCQMRQEQDRLQQEQEQEWREERIQYERKMAERRRQQEEARIRKENERLREQQEQENYQETIVMEKEEVKEVKEDKLRGKLTQYDNTNVGSIYVLEWDEGVGWVKIGSALDPKKRITRLKQQFEGYSDVVIGKTWHIDGVRNFREKEYNLHVLLEKYRKPKTELFKIPFDEAIYHVEEWLNSCEDEENE